MTTTCVVFLSISLLCYLAASLLVPGSVLLARTAWETPGRRLLKLGMGIHAIGLALHFFMSGQSPFSSMLVVISLLIIAVLGSGMMIERYSRIRHATLFAAPLAFLGLLYPMLMPVRFEAAQSILLRYPWLGVHVAISLLGLVGFALAFCTAVSYLIQARQLRRGRLNSFLPALDSAAAATFQFAAAGFIVFTLGLSMGIIWLFGAPGEYLGLQDTKIWMALPTWMLFATYLYRRGVRGSHGSRLKWLVIVGFILALANLVAVRHGFDEEAGPSSAGPSANESNWTNSRLPLTPSPYSLEVERVLLRPIHFT